MQISFRTEVEKLIYEKLVSRGSVVIPEFGLLFVREKSAEIDFIGSQLLPPERKVEFLKAIELEDYALAYSLHNQADLPFENAMHSLQQYKQYILSSILNDNEYKMGPLGTFYNENDSIVFRQSSQFLPGISSAHRKLPFQPITRIAELVEKKPAVLPVVENKRKRRIPWTALGVPLLLLLVTALLYRVFWYPEKDQVVINPVAFYDEQRLNIKPAEEEILNQDAITQIEDETEDSEVQSEGLPDEAAVATEESEFFDENVELAEEPVTDQLECVIIVGAFGNRNNASRMYELISSLGLLPYQDTKAGLSRVGVLSTCERSELLSILRLCRRDLDPSSWILNLE